MIQIFNTVFMQCAAYRNNFSHVPKSEEFVLILKHQLGCLYRSLAVKDNALSCSVFLSRAPNAHADKNMFKQGKKDTGLGAGV